MMRTTLLVVCLLPSLAHAANHLIHVQELFPGTSTEPNAQYVMLQMENTSQTLVSGVSLRIDDASGGTLGTYTFGSNVSSANSTTILIATSQAAALFGMSADLAMTATIATSGGMACWLPGSPYNDCVAWGNFSGSNPPATVGTPFAALTPGKAIRRTGDTGNSVSDFSLVDPAPKNNAGVQGPVDMAPPPPDLTMLPDLTMPPPDFAGLDLLGVDLTPPPPPDLATTTPDFAGLDLLGVDLTAPIVDMATSSGGDMSAMMMPVDKSDGCHVGGVAAPGIFTLAFVSLAIALARRRNLRKPPSEKA